jgi:5-methylcytosine-specific restriction endonuclease McrA
MKYARLEKPGPYSERFFGRRITRKKESSRDKRRERERSHGPGWTDAEWEELLRQCGYSCLACGITEGIVPDHIRPMCRGGAHHISNIQPLCSACNLRKGIQIIDFRTL